MCHCVGPITAVAEAEYAAVADYGDKVADNYPPSDVT